MTDNKKKIGKPDRNLISFKEKYEFNYAVKQLRIVSLERSDPHATMAGQVKNFANLPTRIDHL